MEMVALAALLLMLYVIAVAWGADSRDRGTGPLRDRPWLWW